VTSSRPDVGSGVRVSVLVQTFNHERYIAEALDSVLEQRGVGPFEVLVGDDCSTDGTRSVIDAYVQRHPGVVQPFYPLENMGGGGKVLFAELVTRSRGRYIAWLDGDDYWTCPDKLRIQSQYLDLHPQCSMCFHNAVRRADGAVVPDVLYNPPDQLRRVVYGDLLDANPIAACAPVFRREVLDPLPPWYFRLPWGDLPLYLVAAQRGEIHYLPEVMGVYRVHGDGMYSGMAQLGRHELDAEFFAGLAGLVPETEEGSRRRCLAVALTRSAHEHLRLGDREAARRRLAESFQAWPVDPRRLRRGQGELRRLYLWLMLLSPRRRWARLSRTWDRGHDV
jgi:glycosyltransferase involved in cell wall biosynthesis